MTQPDRWTALGDPTRRVVFERLAEGPRAVAELAKGLPVSRPAVSQHLKILREADLLRMEKRAQQRIYSVNEGNYLNWSEGQRRFIDHLKGLDGENDRPFSSRYVGSMVADIHRTLLYGGIFSCGVAFTLQIVAQRHAPPAHASIILAMEGLFGALGGVILIGEPASARLFLGGALMLAAAIGSQVSLDRKGGKSPARG